MPSFYHIKIPTLKCLYLLLYDVNESYLSLVTGQSCSLAYITDKWCYLIIALCTVSATKTSTFCNILITCTIWGILEDPFLYNINKKLLLIKYFVVYCIVKENYLMCFINEYSYRFSVRLTLLAFERVFFATNRWLYLIYHKLFVIKIFTYIQFITVFVIMLYSIYLWCC